MHPRLTTYFSLDRSKAASNYDLRLRLRNP
jgi:hypothetical protein